MHGEQHAHHKAPHEVGQPAPGQEEQHLAQHVIHVCLTQPGGVAAAAAAATQGQHSKQSAAHTVTGSSTWVGMRVGSVAVSCSLPHGKALARPVEEEGAVPVVRHSRVRTWCCWHVLRGGPMQRELTLLLPQASRACAAADGTAPRRMRRLQCTAAAGIRLILNGLHCQQLTGLAASCCSIMQQRLLAAPPPHQP
eukprot:GHRQ01030586.1.p1 GENE.GHRQ01030586.1~~GHRQ01030586.1.p1  ORF type:complete len:205 (-),score=26.59 GHRQ01030586.1:119-703(-)